MIPEYVLFDVGQGRVEIRRWPDGRYEFRPYYEDHPQSGLSLYANALFIIGGGVWAPVPLELLPSAKMAFDEPS